LVTLTGRIVVAETNNVFRITDCDYRRIYSESAAVREGYAGSCTFVYISYSYTNVYCVVRPRQGNIVKGAILIGGQSRKAINWSKRWCHSRRSLGWNEGRICSGCCGRLHGRLRRLLRGQRGGGNARRYYTCGLNSSRLSWTQRRLERRTQSRWFFCVLNDVYDAAAASSTW
jgi:hypothetical protein